MILQQQHAAELRTFVQRSGSMTAVDLERWISQQGLRNGGGFDDRKLIALAGLVLCRTVGGGEIFQVGELPMPSREERKAKQSPFAVDYVRRALANGPLTESQLGYPHTQFHEVPLSDALTAAGAARIQRVGEPDRYGLVK
jgi:hypothetical protein